VDWRRPGRGSALVVSGLIGGVFTGNGRRRPALREPGHAAEKEHRIGKGRGADATGKPVAVTPTEAPVLPPQTELCRSISPHAVLVGRVRQRRSLATQTSLRGYAPAELGTRIKGRPPLLREHGNGARHLAAGDSQALVVTRFIGSKQSVFAFDGPHECRDYERRMNSPGGRRDRIGRGSGGMAGGGVLPIGRA